MAEGPTTHSLFIAIGRHCVGLERVAERNKVHRVACYDRIRELRIVQGDIRQGGYKGRVAELARYVNAVYKADVDRYDMHGLHPELPGYRLPWEISSLVH